MNSKENINSLDCVNHSLHGLDCKPHMKGFIFNNMQEVWKNVNGFEGLYQISNFGKVKSLPRKWQPKEIILKPGKDKNGYFKVILHKNKIRYNKQVHILVFDNFGKSKRNGHKLQVDHFDENKQNNYIENLQLLTNKII